MKKKGILTLIYQRVYIISLYMGWVVQVNQSVQKINKIHKTAHKTNKQNAHRKTHLNKLEKQCKY